MKKIVGRGQRWLKLFHIFFACLWVGGAFTLTVKQFFINPTDGRELYGILATMDFIDFFVIIPGAIGCLLTALFYSIWTKWGWFKHKWITWKWVILLYGVIFGTYPLGPWLSEMAVISDKLGMAAFSDPTFLHNRLMVMTFGSFQFLTIFVACYLSTMKPFKKISAKEEVL